MNMCTSGLTEHTSHWLLYMSQEGHNQHVPQKSFYYLPMIVEYTYAYFIHIILQFFLHIIWTSFALYYLITNFMKFILKDEVSSQIVVMVWLEWFLKKRPDNGFILLHCVALGYIILYYIILYYIILYYIILYYIILYYILTPWCRVLLEKLTGLQLVKKFLAFYGTWRFITALTSVRHLSLSWGSSIQSIYPHPTSWRSILILSSHLRLGLPSGLFLSDFLTKTLYLFLPSPIRATCPAHLIILDFVTRTMLGEQYRLLSSSLCSLPHRTTIYQ